MEREDQLYCGFIGSIAAAKEFFKIIYEYIVFMIMLGSSAQWLDQNVKVIVVFVTAAGQVFHVKVGRSIGADGTSKVAELIIIGDCVRYICFASVGNVNVGHPESSR